MGAISFIETMDANLLSITKEEFDSNIERTMTELKKERPSISLEDKQQINYENVLHPSRSMSRSSVDNQSLLLDPAKAAALLEKGSQFAQKTMQRPLNFVGKIFQGLSDTSGNSSRASSPVEEYYYQQQEDHHPPLPPRPTQADTLLRQKQQFEANLQILTSMFSNVDDSVCYLVLNANQGDLTKSIDQ